MNNDLISRKALFEKLKVFNDRENGNEHFLFGIETAIEIIKKEPVAFDKEKAVKELREISRGLSNNKNYSAASWIDNAIEIIEKGGLNE